MAPVNSLHGSVHLCTTVLPRVHFFGDYIHAQPAAEYLRRMTASLPNRPSSLFLGLSAKRFNCAASFCETMDFEDTFSFSAESGNITEDDIPGSGRLLGKFYAGLGRKVETVLSLAARYRGRGPAPVAARIIKLASSEAPGAAKKCEKECKTLVKYTRCVWCIVRTGHD